MYLHEALPFLSGSKQIYNQETGTQLELWGDGELRTCYTWEAWVPSIKDLMSGKWEHCT